MRDINIVAEQMARNGLKIAKSLGCAFHFESEFIWEQSTFFSFHLRNYLGYSRLKVLDVNRKRLLFVP